LRARESVSLSAIVPPRVNTMSTHPVEPYVAILHLLTDEVNKLALYYRVVASNRKIMSTNQGVRNLACYGS